MTHSDDKVGSSSKLAPLQVVIVPIYKNSTQLEEISNYVNELKQELSNGCFS